MQKNKTLNGLYADYSAGRLEKKTLEGMIFRVLYKKITSLPGLGKEDLEDFISWLYPRISRAIDNYHSMGSSFAAYINTLVHMASKEYRSQQARCYNAELAALITQVSDMYACESEAEYLEYGETTSRQAQTQNQKNARNSRQLLILLLKCCRFVSGDFLEKVSCKLGVKPEALSVMVDLLNESRKKREANVGALRKLANRQLCRCLFYENILSQIKDNPIVAQRVKKQRDQWRKRLGKTRERLARLPADPSNAKIAELLGLSKSTVDTVLYTLRVRWGNNLNDKNKHILN
ncbi:MAG: hypothetical protein FWD88_02900 [Treponema sp.]|nr:hypothetical protein [Treponema sp.]